MFNRTKKLIHHYRRCRTFGASRGLAMRQCAVRVRRYFEDAAYPPLAKAVPLSGAREVYIETTNICNFKCVFCPESLPDYKARVGGNAMMSVDQFSILASQMKAMGTIKKIHFYVLGEPF